MSNGINHAKKIVIDEAEQLAKELQNGHAGDAHTQGRAIALIVKMITPMYSAEFVTVEDCRKQHETIAIGKQVKLKAGPFCFEGSISPALIFFFAAFAVFSTAVFTIGKIKCWW